MIRQQSINVELCSICGNPESAPSLSAACHDRHHKFVELKTEARSITCDLCHRKLTSGSYIDGATQYGPWANMCERCHRFHGVGLGLGRGQKYDVTTGKKLEG